MRKILLFFAALLLVTAVWAKDALPAPLRVLAERATLKNFPEAKTVTLDEATTVRYFADGTSEERCESWEKVLTEEGRRKLRETSVHYNTFYTEISVPVLEVIRPDGSVIRVDAAKTGKTATSNDGESSDIYTPASKVFKVALPELAVGDVVHRVVVEKNVRARMSGVWCGYYVLQYDQPILHASVTVTGPADRPLRAIAVKDPVPGKKVETAPVTKNPDGTLTWRWSVSGVPAAVPEPNMPPLYAVVQRLLVSTASSWRDVSRWYEELCAPHLQARSPELKAKVAELVKGAATLEEKIARIFHFVSQEIRYLGITTEKTAPGYEPHDVQQTFSRRYGVCRDKAALLAAMLNEAGIAAHPVLFMVGTPKDGEVPNNFFNHAIVAVELPGGGYRLLDATGENAPLELSSDCSNMSYLVARKEGEKLLRTPVVPAERNLLRIHTVCRADAKRMLTGTTTMRFEGINDEIFRNSFVRWPEEKRRQFFLMILKKVLPGAELVKITLTPENLRDLRVPLKAEISYRVPGYLPDSPAEFSLALPEFSSAVGLAHWLTDACALQERKFPLLNDAPCGTSETFALTLPPDCRTISLPAQGKIDEKGLLSFEREIVRKDARTLTGRSMLRIHAVEIPAARYPAYRSSLCCVETLLRARPLALWDYRYWENETKTPFPGADLLVLNESTALRVKGPGSWEKVQHLVCRVLTFGGIRKASKVRIPYNPVWEVVFVDAVVTLPDGSKRVLQKPEINVMDADWVAAAPRYPAGKVLIAAFPGVVPGSTIDCTVVRKYKDHPFIAGVCCFSREDPIVRREFSVTSELNRQPLPVSPAPHGVEESVSTASGGLQTRTWRATDVPPYASEPDQAPDSFFAMPLLFSNGNWHDYAVTLHRELERLSTAQPACEALGRKLSAEAEKRPLPAGKKGEAALLRKVRVIRDWAARNLRSAGPSLDELPFSLLTPGDRTLKERYGCSADRAIAIAAICRGAGVKTEFVAASPLPALPQVMKQMKHYPRPLFTGVLVRVPELDLYMNDTDEYAEPGALAAHGCVGLTLPKGALTKLCASRGNAPWESIRYFVKIDPDGSADLEVKVTLFGMNYAQNKRYWEKTVGRARKNAIAEWVANYSRSAVLTAPPVIDFSGYPGEIVLKVKIPDFAPMREGFRQFELPAYDGFAKALKPTILERTTPFYRRADRRMMVEWMIQLPPDSCWIDTRKKKISGGRYGSSRFTSQLKIERTSTGSYLKITNEINLPAELLTPHDYAGLVLLQKALSDPAMSRILLRRVDAPAGKK